MTVLQNCCWATHAVLWSAMPWVVVGDEAVQWQWPLLTFDSVNVIHAFVMSMDRL